MSAWKDSTENMKCTQKVTKCTCGPGRDTQTSVMWHPDPQRPAMAFAEFINRERSVVMPGHIKKEKPESIFKKSEIVLKGIYCWILSRIIPPSQVPHHIVKTSYFKWHTHMPVVSNTSFLPLLSGKMNSYRKTITH